MNMRVMCMYVCIHRGFVYIHTCIYIHTYFHSYIHTYMHTYIHDVRYSCKGLPVNMSVYKR
jgi:hypothetical protein